MNQIKTKVFLFSHSGPIITRRDFDNPEQVEFISNGTTFPNDSQEKLVIIEIESLESNILDKLLKIEEQHKQFIFIIVKENQGLLISKLVKLGYVNIFVLPQEKLNLNSKLNEKFRLLSQSSNSREKSKTIKKEQDAFFNIIGSSQPINQIINTAKKVSKNPDLNILITGETGTGKGLLAETIHNYATNNSAPFVDVVCTAIPESLLESELFGHERGAFTDAKVKKIGLFELAEGGTIFLDEIGDMSLALQAKLLRAIEQKVIRRVGGTNDIKINTRIISATNQELLEQVSKKLFRRDLYYRLNVVNIELPPLRERIGDLRPLVEHFIKIFNKQYGRNVSEVDNDVFDYINSYDWPGNIRELSNALERGVVLADDGSLKLKNLMNMSIGDLKKMIKLKSSANPDQISLDINYKETQLDEIQSVYAKNVFNKLNNNKSQTAKLLGVSRPTLEKLLGY